MHICIPVRRQCPKEIQNLSGFLFVIFFVKLRKLLIRLNAEYDLSLYHRLTSKLDVADKYFKHALLGGGHYSAGIRNFLRKAQKITHSAKRRI